MFDSPRLVVGYHGCSQSTKDDILKNRKHLNKSTNTYDWLGEGIYFWENDYDRALQWAETKENPTVIGAFIKLGNCLDLLTVEKTKLLTDAFNELKNEYSLRNKQLPSNKIIKNGISFKRYLDCFVIEKVKDFNNELIQKRLNLSERINKSLIKIQKDPAFYDTIRAMFPEGTELYYNAGFRKQNHIQICVINPNAIIGYFDPLDEDKNYKVL